MDLQKLKKRIRFLRIIQRIVACLISIAALVPIAMTLHKYLTTKDVFLVAPTPTGGTVNRTAWTAQPKTWPTYVFFSTAVVSLTIHLGVLLGYCCSIRTSNILDTVGTWVVSIELSAQLILWIVVSAIYKYQSEKVENGRHNDLWGWTCSGPAQAIQNTFEDVIQFGTFCDIQSAGWYAGLVQIGAIVLALVIMLLAWRRKKSKKAVRRSAIRSLQRGVEGVEGVEGYRHQKV
jgi:hypothetical protein